MDDPRWGVTKFMDDTQVERATEDGRQVEEKK